MTVKINSNNESAVETQCIASLPTDTQSTADLQIRIRELEKEIARLHGQIKEQRYGLTWLDVPEAFETESENKIPILEEVKEKAIDAAGRDALNASTNNTPPHIIIEGDNYHALSCLNYTHRGKIDVIYIDPPYNTGSDGFTYKDKRFLKEFPDGSPVPKEHPLRHSYWLSFMSKRLELAKNLLSDKGVIFISIDDNEQANLKLLCDKVFGEDNFVANFMWMRTATASNLSHKVRSKMEYILCYQKKELNFILNGGLTDGGDVPLLNAGNKVSDVIFPKQSLTLRISNGIYTKGIYDKVEILEDFIVEDGIAKNNLKLRGRFKWTQTTIDEEIEKGTFFIIKTIKFSIRFQRNGKTIKTPSNLITKDECEVGTNEEGFESIIQIFKNSIFNYSKPISLIRYLLNMHLNGNSTILDFFAGSGTTLHATMKLNAEDGGHRQCILVQQREGDNNICENVTYERNRRVMCGYTNAKGEQVEGLGGRLKYYRTAFVGKHASHNAIDADRVELSRKAGYLLALGENTLEEITHTDTYQIFADNKEKASMYTAIFFTENYAKLPEFVAEIEKLQSLKETLNVLSIPKINVYIFCWGTPDIFESEFDDLRGIAIKAIPQPILDVYKSINQ